MKVSELLSLFIDLPQGEEVYVWQHDGGYTDGQQLSKVVGVVKNDITGVYEIESDDEDHYFRLPTVRAQIPLEALKPKDPRPWYEKPSEEWTVKDLYDAQRTQNDWPWSE